MLVEPLPRTRPPGSRSLPGSDRRSRPPRPRPRSLRGWPGPWLRSRSGQVLMPLRWSSSATAGETALWPPMMFTCGEKVADESRSSSALAAGCRWSRGSAAAAPVEAGQIGPRQRVRVLVAACQRPRARPSQAVLATTATARPHDGPPSHSKGGGFRLRRSPDPPGGGRRRRGVLPARRSLDLIAQQNACGAAMRKRSPTSHG
jgi:hypothetical protein